MITTTQRPQAGIRGGQRRNWMAPAPQPATPSKPKKFGRFTLANDTVSVVFNVTETQIVVTTRPGRGNFPYLNTRETMTLEQARKHYAKLLREGYTEW